MSLIPETWAGILEDEARREEYARQVGQRDQALGSFLQFDPAKETKLPTGSLTGLPLAVKDNIAVKDWGLTCGSKILENLVSPYDATVISKLKNEGAQVVGKTNLDEFGMGSSNEHSALAKTVNPWDATRVPGGSSGGSAAAVAAGLVPVALGSDTGGSVRQPANFCGVYGLKPTYGSVSRYGLTAYASSLEVIGAMAKDLKLLEAVFQAMAGKDERDQSSVTSSESLVDGRRIAVLKIGQGELEDAVDQSYRSAVQALRAAGYETHEVTLESLEYVVAAYYTIATAEASANLARFNGIRYGHAPDFAENPAELMRKARHEGFGDEVKLRILLGTYVLRSGFQDQYYVRAQKVRTLIRRELEALFSDSQLLMMPVFPTQAFPLGDAGMDDFQQRTADLYTCLANLTGSPALSIPTALEKGLPTGVQLLAPAFAESRLFQAAESLSAVFPVPDAPDCLSYGRIR